MFHIIQDFRDFLKNLKILKISKFKKILKFRNLKNFLIPYITILGLKNSKFRKNRNFKMMSNRDIIMFNRYARVSTRQGS